MFQPGCECGKKAQDGPVPRPPEVHAWAGLAHLEKTLDSASALAAKFGLPAPGKDALQEAFSQESGLGAAAVAELDLGKPVWTAGVKKEEGAAGTAYTYVYAFPFRDEKRLREAVAKDADLSEQEGVLKLTPKSGGASKPFFAVIERGHVVVSPAAAALKTARGFILRTLVPSPSDGDVSITLTQDFVSGWQTGIAAAADEQSAVVAGIVRRMAGRVASVKELNLRADITAAEVVVALRATADAGPMHALIKRQETGSLFAANIMPAKSWLFFADRYSAESLAETVLDVKQLLASAPEGEARRVAKAAGDLAGTLKGKIALAVSGSTILAAAQINDASVARAALDEMIDVVKGPAEVRRDGDFAIVSLPAGIVPPLVAGRPEIGTYVRGDQLLFTAGLGAEEAVRKMADGTKEPSLEKNAAFAKVANDRPHRVGLLYLSIAQMLGAMVAAVPGAPAPEAAPDAPGVVLEWGVDDKRTAMEVTLRAPAEAFATLGPLLKSLPLMGGGPAMPRTPWMPTP